MRWSTCFLTFSRSSAIQVHTRDGVGDGRKGAGGRGGGAPADPVRCGATGQQEDNCDSSGQVCASHKCT